MGGAPDRLRSVSLDQLAIVVTAISGGVAGVLAPAVIRRLREPEVEAPGPARPTLRELADTPHLVPYLATVGALTGALVGWQVGWTPVLGAWAYLNGVCLILGYIDGRTRLLLTQLIAPSYAVVAVLLVAAALGDWRFGGIEHAVLGWAVMGGFYFLMWRVGPPGLGYGDVRLSGLLALCLGYLGWAELLTGLYSGFVLGGLGSLVLVLLRRVTMKTHIPFGPYMMAGALAGLTWGGAFATWYASR
jgi:leader peptidase (prepilin peptidase)/N-methyltransferase